MADEKNIDTTAMKMPDGTTTHRTRLGPMLGILLILLVVVAVGLYLWGATLRQNEALVPEREIVNNEPETPRADADIEIFSALSSSNELDAIEADIESTSLDSLESDLNTMEAEMNEAPPRE